MKLRFNFLPLLADSAQTGLSFLGLFTTFGRVSDKLLALLLSDCGASSLLIDLSTAGLECITVSADGCLAMFSFLTGLPIAGLE